MLGDVWNYRTYRRAGCMRISGSMQGNDGRIYYWRNAKCGRDIDDQPGLEQIAESATGEEPDHIGRRANDDKRMPAILSDIGADERSVRSVRTPHWDPDRHRPIDKFASHAHADGSTDRNDDQTDDSSCAANRYLYVHPECDPKRSPDRLESTPSNLASAADDFRFSDLYGAVARCKRIAVQLEIRFGGRASIAAEKCARSNVEFHSDHAGRPPREYTVVRAEHHRGGGFP